MKTKQPVYESMHRFAVGERWVVRVWMTRATAEEAAKAVLNDTRLTTIGQQLAIDPHLLPQTIVQAYLALQECAAVEVLNPYGNGIVAYAEWP